MSGSIFISFASQDRKVATTLCQALEGRGFHCWISSRDILPGENFQIAIVRAIRKAKLMLLVFTANSNNSAEMNKELALASQNKLTVVPLRIEDVAPNDAFAYEFATRQWIDFFSDWELAMNALASQIAHVLGPEEMEAAAAAVAAKAAPAAPEPPAARVAAPSAEPTPAETPAESPVEAAAEEEAPVEAEPEAPAEAPEPASEAPFFSRAAASEDAAPASADAVPEPALAAAPARKKGSPVPMIIGGVVLLAAAAAAAFVVMGKKPAATATVAATPAVSAATAAGPTVTLNPAGSSAAPAAAGTPSSPGTPSAVASGESAGDTAATAAPDGETKASRRRAKANSAAGSPPLRASRSDIPY
ncbi:MAG: toll/interleukin-1 receptor domain-containing protein [Proteobacteria bacterium]|nr:toll/interleukin-1 receptor domain-containing protein [Pseudomonadota bacterium]